MDRRQVALGAALLFVSSVVLVRTGALVVETPLYVAAAASLTLAAGSWLAGRPEERGRI